MRPLLAVAMLLLACDYAKPIEVRQTNNSDVNVELLFEHDGCKVYRFVTFSRDCYHYFAKCPGAQVATESSHSEGSRPSRTVTEEIPTVEATP